MNKVIEKISGINVPQFTDIEDFSIWVFENFFYKRSEFVKGGYYSLPEFVEDNQDDIITAFNLLEE